MHVDAPARMEFVPDRVKLLRSRFEVVVDHQVEDVKVERQRAVFGVVERERGFVLHTDDYISAGSSTIVADGVALTGTREVLEAIAGRLTQIVRGML